MAHRIGTARTAVELASHFGGRAFSSGEAAASGVSPTRLADALRAGTVRRLRPDAYLASTLPDLGAERDIRIRQFTDSIRHLGLSVAAGNETAADIWGLPLGRASEEQGEQNQVTMLVANAPGLKFGRRPGVRIRRLFQLPAHHITIGHQGTPVTTPLRTALDLSRGLPRERAMIPLVAGARLSMAHRITGHIGRLSDFELGDVTEMVRSSGITGAVVEELQRMTEELRGSRGIRSATAILPVVEPLLESPLEAMSWVRIITSRLPVPQPQAWLRDAQGCMRRVDFLWEEFGVIGEADGLLKYDDPLRLPEEKLRQEDLERTGHTVVRWTWRDMFDHPERALARISAALTRRRHPQWS